MRAFLALVPDAAALEVLRAYQQQLVQTPWAHQVKWVSANHWHLTVRFLGEITNAQRLQFARMLSAALREQSVPRSTRSSANRSSSPHHANRA